MLDLVLCQFVVKNLYVNDESSEPRGMVNEDSVRSPLGGSMQTERMCIRVEINHIVASSRIMLCYICGDTFS